MSDATGTPRPDDPNPEPAAAPAPSTDAEALPAADPAGTGAAPAPIEEPAVVPHAGLRYAVLRIAMLVTVGGVLYLVGMRGWLLLFTAVLVSAVLSFFVFMRQREAAARNLEATIEARRHHHADERDAPPAQ
jgi:hypothetical protein